MTDMDVWNKEVHHCFDCGGIVEFGSQRDVDLFTYSGLCSQCRNKVLEDMYQSESTERIKQIIDLVDNAIAIIADIRADIRKWISKQQ